MSRKRLGDMLLDEGHISDAQLQAALTEQSRWGGRLGKVLVDMRVISEATLVSFLGRQLNIPTIDISQVVPSQEALSLVPADTATQHSLVPFAVEPRFLDVAMADPLNLGIIDELRMRTQLNIRPHLTGPTMIEKAIVQYYGRGTGRYEVDMRPGSIPFEEGTSPPGAPKLPSMQQLQNDRFAPPAIELELETVSRLPSDPKLELQTLQKRVTTLEDRLAKEEDIVRQLLALLVDKRVATREEILERIG